MKTCNGCGLEKNFDEFYKHNFSIDGCSKICKNCKYPIKNTKVCKSCNTHKEIKRILP